MASRSNPGKLRDPFAEDPEENTNDIVGGTYDPDEDDPDDDGPQAGGVIHQAFPGENTDGVRTAVYHRKSDGGFDRASKVTADLGPPESAGSMSPEVLEGPPGSEKWSIDQWTKWYEESTGRRLEMVAYTTSPLEMAPGGKNMRGWWYTFYSQNRFELTPFQKEYIRWQPRYWSNVKGRFLLNLDGHSGHRDDGGPSLFAHHLACQLDEDIRDNENQEVTDGNLNAEINRMKAGVKSRDFAHE